MEIVPSPAALEEQNQNPVERDVQTVKKGVSAMMIDQSSLSAAYWCFAVTMYVEAKNCVLNVHSSSVTPMEAVTREAPNIGRKFRFPFGAKTVVARVGPKDYTFQTKNEYAVVLGAADASGQVPVRLPGRGKSPDCGGARDTLSSYNEQQSESIG